MGWVKSIASTIRSHDYTAPRRVRVGFARTARGRWMVRLSSILILGSRRDRAFDQQGLHAPPPAARQTPRGRAAAVGFRRTARHTERETGDCPGRRVETGAGDAAAVRLPREAVRVVAGEVEGPRRPQHLRCL